MNGTNNTQRHDEIDLLALVGTLWDNKILIAAVTFVFAAVGVSYALLATPIYQATSLVQVEEKQGGLPGMDDISSLLGTTSTAVTEIELIKSRTVLGKVVDDLNLDITIQPRYFPIIGKAVARRFDGAKGELADPWFGDTYAWGGEQVAITRMQVPERQYGESHTLVPTARGWQLFNGNEELVLEGSLNAAAEANGYALMVTELTAHPGVELSVTKQRRHTAIITLQQNIGASERGKDSGIISLSFQHEDPRLAAAVLAEVGQNYVRQNVERNSAEAAQSLAFLEAKLPEIKTDLEAAEGRLNNYQVTAETIDITAEAQALLDQIVELEKGISELEMQRAEIEQRFRTSHPRYRAWASQMAELKQRRADLDSRIGRLPATQQDLVRLRRDVEVGNEIYLQMLGSVQQLNVARAGTVGNVRVVDGAAVNVEEPVKPKRALIAVIATLLGGFIGVAAVLLRAAINRGVENPEDIEKIGLPVYATVPLSATQEGFVKHKTGRLAQRATNKVQTKLLAVTNPADLAVESLRSLRTSLHFGMMDAKNNVLMISGPSPDVGKTFVSTNLAAVMAQAGQKVLLVDADVRRGTCHDVFQVANPDGLSELLVGKATMKEVVHTTSAENLSFLARGTVPPNPSELLMSKRFGDLIEEVSSDYDLVIVDTAPILAVTDPAIVGKHAGTTLLVARFGLNPVKEIELTNRRFEQNGVAVKGVIFNAVVKKSSAHGYSYGYYNYAYEPHPL